MTFFTQIFHFVYYKLAVERKRKKILLEYLRQCEKMHFKTIDCDGIDLKRFFKTFFLNVVKFARKKFFTLENLKDMKNCLFAKIYAPLYLEIIFNRIWWLKKTVMAGYFFCFCIHVWTRSKSNQHRSCIFHQKIGIRVYSSNRCSITLRGRIEKLESYQRFVETILAVLLNFSADSETSFK